MPRPKGSLNKGCPHSPDTCEACRISREYERELKSKRWEVRREAWERQPEAEPDSHYMADAPF